MGPVLIPVIIFIVGVIAIVGVVTYLADKSAEHHDQG
jgi:hypothetical protein